MSIDEAFIDLTGTEKLFGPPEQTCMNIKERVKKETGLTITDYMNQVKILNSLSQLSKTNDLILKVALDNGFNSQEYYCEIFYKVMNQTPSNYRKISQNIKSTKINELKDIKEEILRIKDYKVLTLNKPK